MVKIKSRFSDEDMHRFPVGLPRSLSEKVQDLAKKNRKSLSLMCWELIEEAMRGRDESREGTLLTQQEMMEKRRAHGKEQGRSLSAEKDAGSRHPERK